MFVGLGSELSKGSASRIIDIVSRVCEYDCEECLPDSKPSSSRWIMAINEGCLFRMLYVKGMIITMAAGGADRERRARRFTKDARRLAGRWLEKADGER